MSGSMELTRLFLTRPLSPQHGSSSCRCLVTVGDDPLAMPLIAMFVKAEMEAGLFRTGSGKTT